MKTAESTEPPPHWRIHAIFAITLIMLMEVQCLIQRSLR